ncbi:MAG: hypothetical protein JSS02_03090, partial [Planctomycetes bacterium]|nr:hypothetical protein [Planctomycetota bacterium]
MGTNLTAGCLMIFRLSEKLAKRLKVRLRNVAPQDPNPFADWSANLFMAGATPHIIMTNTASLYSLVVPARGMNDERTFVRQILGSLQEMLVADGLQTLHKQFIAPVTGTLEFSKSLNRSVSGSMNDLVVQAKSHLIGNPL